MDGFQLCREVKTNEKLKNIAFVFYTSTYTDPKDEEFAMSLGAEKFIVKPTEPDAFIEILKEVIRSYETGTLVAPKPPVEEETVYFKEYNERLIKKLEDKMLQLENASKALRESETKYRELIDTANDVSILTVNCQF
jgi:response regulator RpfG family c-di-GMP phosphodiesterase